MPRGPPTCTLFPYTTLFRSEIVDGIRAAARGERVVIHRRTQRATIDPQLRWPGRDAGLTVRESELLVLLPTGMTNHQLADRKSTRLNSSHTVISYAVFCLKK